MEGTQPQPEPVKMLCVCSTKNCRHHENSPKIEFNFADEKIYWLCPSCKKMNEMSIKAVSNPLPKSRLMR